MDHRSLFFKEEKNKKGKKVLVDNEEGLRMFDFYVDVMLMKVAGKHLWDKKIRHHGTVSKAVEQEYGKAAILPGTEAYLYTLFLGMESKWKYIASCHVESTTVDRESDEFQCPYTEAKGGQQKWGGWTKEGRDKYKEVEQEVKDAREQDHVDAVEEACLKRLRAKHGYDEAKKKKKAKKPLQEEEDNDSDCELEY